MEARAAEQAGDRVAIVSWLQAFGRRTGAQDAEVGEWLLAAERTRAYELAGAASIFQLAEQLLGWEGRTTHERLRVARALESLPRVAAALRAGEIHWTKVRELSRVAVQETEAEWLEVARRSSVRELEAQVSGRRAGDRPGDPQDPELVERPLVFRAKAELWGIWQAVGDRVRREVDARLTDEEVLLHALRIALQGATQEDGRREPPCQMALTVCAVCERGFVVAGGEEVPAPDAMVERALCDATCIGFLDEEKARLAAAVVDREELPPVLAAHVGTNRRRRSRSVRRSIERKVFQRDRERCSVPGCNHRLYLEIHHVQLVMDGGTDDPENLVLLCSTHHRLLHEGRLLAIRRERGVDFYRADGTPCGTALSPAALEANADAFASLRGMRFPEREARRLLGAARGALERSGVMAPTAEALVKEALRASRRGKLATVVAEEPARYGASGPRGHRAGRAHVGRAAA